MRVLVDTPVWSLAFRRRQRTPAEQALVAELSELVLESRATLIGPIRQEVLSGLSDARQFALLRDHLAAFDDLTLSTEVYERAAELYNTCRAKGVQGSHVDFLICAAAQSHAVTIFTTDGDFENYSNHIELSLHPFRTL